MNSSRPTRAASTIGQSKFVAYPATSRQSRPVNAPGGIFRSKPNGRAILKKTAPAYLLHNPRILCFVPDMPDEKKIIPPPTIRPSTPAPPPPSPSFETADPEPPQPKEAEVIAESEEREEEAPESPPQDDVEVDLVKRLLGGLVDALVAGGLGYLGNLVSGSEAVQWIIFAVVILTRDSLPFLEGQSLGKKVMKTMAVKEDGSSLSGDWVNGALRNLLPAIPVAGILECFVLLTRSGRPGDGRRLGDDWAKTKVISVE